MCVSLCFLQVSSWPVLSAALGFICRALDQCVVDHTCFQITCVFRFDLSSCASGVFVFAWPHSVFPLLTSKLQPL